MATAFVIPSLAFSMAGLGSLDGPCKWIGQRTMGLAAEASDSSKLVALGGQDTDAKFKPKLTINAELRWRYESKKTKDFNADNERNPFENLVRQRLIANYVDKDWSVYVRAQGVYDALKDKSGPTYLQQADWDQAYYQYNKDGVMVRLGRQAFQYGSKRLLATSDWLNFGYTWDAGLISVKRGKWQVDAFSGRRGLMQPGYPFPSLTGLWTTYTPNKKWYADIYTLYDYQAATTGDSRVWTFGARPVVKVAPNLEASVEYIKQSGAVGTKKKDAYAYAAGITYTSPKKNFTLTLEKAYASGGDQSDTTTDHTFDQIWPSNTGRYSYFSLQGFKNMEAYTIRSHYDLNPKWSFDGNVSLWRVADDKDYWYGNTGSAITGYSGSKLYDATGSAGKDVGWEFNIHATYNVNKTTSVTAGFAQFTPGSFVRDTNGGKADKSNWFYFQFQVKL